VLLDIIYNHTGNNWFYRDGSAARETLPYRYSPPYPIAGWRSAQGTLTGQIETREDGAWPSDFQNPEWYTRAGAIGRWDPAPWENPLHPDNEFRRGDFFDLKDVNLNRGDALGGVIRAYQYWIALSDCDGFRIDTVKHVSYEASRNFCGAIREYAEAIGKYNFWLLGEVTGGGELARSYLDIFGRNIDAILDIGEPARRLGNMVKGLGTAEDVFSQYAGHDSLGSHRETGRYHVSILDDHDMVGRPGKFRFAALNTIEARDLQVAHAVGAQLTLLGVPCVYYGTEQAFDGSEARADPANDGGFEDRYIREAMFGGSFGAFGTAGCHFFNPQHSTYRRIAALARVRRHAGPAGLALRRGRQYLRETAAPGQGFALPRPGEIAAWSRIMHHQEVVVALNTHGMEARAALVTVDANLNPPGTGLRTRYHGHWTDADLARAGTDDPPATTPVEVERSGGRAFVRVELPAAGMVVMG
jgi:hypothetical protein